MLQPIISVACSVPSQIGESPLWDPERKVLYWIDIAGRSLHRLHPESGSYDSWSLPAEPGCVALADAGGVVIAMRSGVFHMHVDTGTLRQLAEAPYDQAHIRFNDGRCDSLGRLWVGTLFEPRTAKVGSLFRFERGHITDMQRPVTVSNGIAFSIDERVIYHADTTAHRIVLYDFDIEAGTLGSGRVFHQFGGDRNGQYGGRPDGAAVDSEGAYWCAMYEGSRLLRLSGTGEVLQEIELPVRCPTMLAFGGDDLKTIYVTSARHNRPVEELKRHPLSGCVLSLRVETPGRLEHKCKLPEDFGN